MTAQQPKGGKPPKVKASRRRKPLWKIKREMGLGRLPLTTETKIVHPDGVRTTKTLNVVVTQDMLGKRKK